MTIRLSVNNIEDKVRPVYIHVSTDYLKFHRRTQNLPSSYEATSDRFELEIAALLTVTANVIVLDEYSIMDLLRRHLKSRSYCKFNRELVKEDVNFVKSLLRYTVTCITNCSFSENLFVLV